MVNSRVPGFPTPADAPGVTVVNESDQLITLVYEGGTRAGTLTISAPAGFTVQATGASCAPVEGQASAVRCPGVSGLPFPRVAVTTTPSSTSTQTETVKLFRGCNNVSLTWPDGTPIAIVAAAVAPASAVRAVWRFGAAARRFHGWTSIPDAPNDLTTVGRLDTAFICMDGPGSLTRPTI